ncbi:MAG: hypothetical protein ACE5JU_24325, partial [Candidatus Binatia bacterium]
MSGDRTRLLERDKQTLHSPMEITVIGLGHVGLPTALGLAEKGWYVRGTDSDPRKINCIRGGRSPFYEPGLEGVLHRHLEDGSFLPTENVEAAIRTGTVLFICVGTPQRESGQADLSQLEAVARLI